MLLAVPDMRCDERYGVTVQCAGKRFLFTRRDVANVGDAWETVVRVAEASGGTEGILSQGRSLVFSNGSITLATQLLMSHNTAFLCRHNRTLVALGGQGYRDNPAEVGVVQRSADAGVRADASLPAICIGGRLSKRCTT